MITDKVHSWVRSMSTKRFEQHASPEAIDACLADAAAARRALDRHAAWLVELSARRRTEQAAGTWPARAGYGTTTSEEAR